MSEGLHHVKLHLTREQLHKASRGHQIQVAHHHIGNGHNYHVHPETHRKLHHAHHHKKGVRIHLTHHELKASGFLDFLKKIASPVLSGIQGVAKEIAPQYADTIDSVRNGIRSATGYGVKKHHAFAPNVNESIHFEPGNLPDHAGRIKKHHKRKAHGRGEGIYPAGY